MWSHNQILILYLHFTTLTIFVSPNDELDKYLDGKIVSTKQKHNIINVNILKESCGIYIYDNMDITNSVTNNKILFYYYSNCIFARLMQKPLNYLLNLFFTLKNNRNVTKVFEDKDNLEGINVFIINYMTNLAITVLLNFLNIMSYPFINTNLLKALLLFNIKLNHMWLHLKVTRVVIDDLRIHWKIILIPIFIDVINDIQNFVLLNCDLPNNYNIKNYFAYKTNIPGSLTSTTVVSEEKIIKLEFHLFYKNIIPNNLKQFYFSYKNMLLNNIMNSDDFESHALSHIEIQFGVEYNIITIKEFLNYVLKSTELEVVFLYLKSVYKAIIKLLCHKVIQTFQCMMRNFQNYSTKFIQINFLYTELINILPTEVISVLRSLEYINKNNKLKKKDINNIKEVLNNYITKLDNNYDIETSLKSLKININLKKKAKEQKLKTYLNKIIIYIEEYKCFIQVFKFLNNEYNRYNTPGMNKGIEIITFINKNFLKNNIYVEREENNINKLEKRNHPLTLQIFNFLIKKVDQINKKEEVENKFEFYTNIINEFILQIKYYLVELSSEKRDYYSNEIALNLLPIINIGQGIIDNLEYDEIQRLIFISLTIIIKFGQIFDSNISVVENYNSPESFVFENKLDSTEVKYTNMEMKSTWVLPENMNLYEIYLNSSNENNFKNYDNIITFNWNGKQINIGDIFLHANNTILDPKMYYALFDVLFSFSFSVIYLETYFIWNKYPSSFYNNLDINYYRKINNTFRESFPLHFNTLLNYINMNIMINKDNSIKIENNLRYFGVLINNKNSFNEKHILYNNENEHYKKVEKLLTSVDKVLKCYNELINYFKT